MIEVIVCSDNDEAGEKMYEDIKEKYGNDFIIKREKSENKDWNEDLKKMSI